MKNDLFIKDGIIIPEHELEITTSKSGGAGGQHVNKTDTRITLRWNIIDTVALSFEQKKFLLEKLRSRLSTDGDLIINNSESRSQKQNKEAALDNLVKIIKKAFHVPKRRFRTGISKSVKESRLDEKNRHSKIKKLRGKKVNFE